MSDDAFAMMLQDLSYWHQHHRPACPACRRAALPERQCADTWTPNFVRALKEGHPKAETAPVHDPETTPVPMLLWCPECGVRHVDEGEFATKHHHTHACQHCGMVWRPAIVCTVGVVCLPGFGGISKRLESAGSGSIRDRLYFLEAAQEKSEVQIADLQRLTMEMLDRLNDPVIPASPNARSPNEKLLALSRERVARDLDALEAAVSQPETQNG